MKRNSLFTIACSCWLSILAYGSAAAEQPCGQPWQTPLTTVQGQIKEVYYAVPPGTQRQGLHLGVQTDSGKYVVIHVFPKECVDKKPALFQFRKGDQVEAKGSAFSTQKGRQQNICAATITSPIKLEPRNEETGSINTALCGNAPDCQQLCQSKCQRTRMPQRCLSVCQSQCKQGGRR